MVNFYQSKLKMTNGRFFYSLNHALNRPSFLCKSYSTASSLKFDFFTLNMKSISAKVILVGNEGVGKTSLVLKFMNKNFNHLVSPTVGASLFKCCVNFNDALINMQIWDTAGQERFQSMVPLYYRNVDAAFIVFDITRNYTFTVAKHWANELTLHIDSPVVLTLIGNKKDLSKQRTVSLEEALSFAEEIGAFYYESSVQEFQGVQEIFFNTAKELLKFTGYEDSKVETKSRKESTKQSCCWP